MFTYMTRFGLWRTAVDLHPEELDESIDSAKIILAYLMSEDGPAIPNLPNIAGQWVEHEHALANYGAVLCHRQWIHRGDRINPESTWFAARQAEIRAAGWPYSRPKWATNVEVLTQHRQKLVNLRPSWYGPKFDMKPMEVLA